MKMYSLVVLVALVACAQGYSSGAPESACEDMIPRHPVPPQKSKAPYTITTNTKVVKAGSPLEVVISGKGASDTIRGLLLQARVGDKPVGTFTIPPNEPFQLLNCGTAGNSVTHTKHDAKLDKQTVSFTWTPPADLNDEIKFRATIALNGAVFWVGVESAPIKVTN
ncbi:putative defense protein Hdd11 [Ostrinia nubilalis]|uniref:Immune-induced protein n=1 Tax=Ostrinia furnacalis TaxID=93504 RepID=T2C8M2_OSTFU|nr:putative defense protein Hdd11 [Ostrinia furnacalis]XP_028179344.1 putative defense protein Hdd11 [Ostrinia furnacalis]AGV28583.1 immune-induced protein [Ostrinia furnacalis]